jgi:uncharacterized protein (DUF2236 family)
MTWIYGGQEGLQEGDRLRSFHSTINFTDTKGVRHHALAAEPWAWIMLTAPYTLLRWSSYFTRDNFTDSDKEALYAEYVQLMRNLHVAEKRIPATFREYSECFDQMIATDLVAHPIAYAVLDATRTPPLPRNFPVRLRPLWRVVSYFPGRLQFFVTVGLLPPQARAILGIGWTDKNERLLRMTGKLFATVIPLLPERLRYLPIAYEARRAHRANERLRHALAHRPRGEMIQPANRH